MQHRLDRPPVVGRAPQLRMGAVQQRLQQHRIAHLPHHQRHLEHLAHHRGVAIHQVVEHQRLVTRPAQRPNRVTADVAGAAGDENPHRRTSVPDCRRAM